MAHFGKSTLYCVAIAIGIGVMVKITPVLMLPVALKRIWAIERAYGRLAVRWVWVGLISGLTILAITLPFLLIDSAWITAFIRALFGRSSWETLWAVWEGYYGFGQVAGDRLNPAETNFAIHPASLPWGVINAAFALLFGAIFLLKADLNQPRRVVAFGGLILSIFLLYSKGYSPQFLVYILPFIIILMPNLVGLGYAFLLTALNVLEQPIYFVMLPNETWLLTAIVSARFIIWIVLAIEFGMILWARSNADWLQRSVRWALLIAAIGGLLLFVPSGISAYQQARFVQNPHQDIVGFLKNQSDSTTLLLTDQARYRQLYPHLRSTLDIRLAGGNIDFVAANPTSDLIADQARVWFLSTDDRGQVVANELAQRGTPISVLHFDTIGTLTLFDFVDDTTFTPLARADNGIELLRYGIEKYSDAINLTLYWRTDQTITEDFTVFTQLLNDDGQLVTSHDGIPVDGVQPTSTWMPNHVVTDRHHLSLPDNLVPGIYQLVTGMYDHSGNRLPLYSPTGDYVSENAVLLLEVEIP